ncbi:cysteine desulfurase [Thermotomaculum hydrothermale]|uniref:cysteine desulfurase n=1 Tax=Thermotomaculum hydrothermale TaxID=981385 RepID=A0A7R6Q0U1_9BACT|nr:cysteine desulfurase family protein [Thermotomaculum hydrothermale]BBB33508.1 cysteine desulfurase [Thermotomaculum hydrothermale]
MIYLDSTATTVVLKEVADEVYKYLTKDYGNPSSSHKLGIEANKLVEKAREVLLKSLKLENTHLCVFTSGGSEGNTQVLKGVAKLFPDKSIVIGGIEHNSIRTAATDLLIEGKNIKTIEVEKDGKIDIEKLLNLIDKDTKLVSIMKVNNETGIIFNIEEIAKKVKEKNPSCLFHTDFVQGFMKIKADLKHIDFVTISAHKIFAPKGVGALFVKKGINLPSLIAGSQEYGLRGGTHNVAGIAGLKKSVEILKDKVDENFEKTLNLRKAFKDTLANNLEDFEIFEPVDFSPYILGLFAKGIESEVIVRMLSEKGVFISAGSACSAKDKVKSKTILALGLNPDEYLRISLNPVVNSEEDVKTGAKTIADTIKEYRELFIS